MRQKRTVDEAIVDFSAGVKYLDLKDDVADAVAGAIPTKALCAQDCKGRCHSCGANLNRGPCACGGEGSGRGAEERIRGRGGLGALGGGDGRGVGGGLTSKSLSALLKLKADLQAQEQD